MARPPPPPCPLLPLALLSLALAASWAPWTQALISWTLAAGLGALGVAGLLDSRRRR